MNSEFKIIKWLDSIKTESTLRLDTFEHDPIKGLAIYNGECVYFVVLEHGIGILEQD